MALLFVKTGGAEGVTKPLVLQSGSVVQSQSNFLGDEAEPASEELLRETLRQMSKGKLQSLLKTLEVTPPSAATEEEVIDSLVESFSKLGNLAAGASPSSAKATRTDRYELSVETVGDGSCLMYRAITAETTVADILKAVQPVADEHMGAGQYALDFAVHVMPKEDAPSLPPTMPAIPPVSSQASDIADEAG